MHMKSKSRLIDPPEQNDSFKRIMKSGGCIEEESDAHDDDPHVKEDFPEEFNMNKFNRQKVWTVEGQGDHLHPSSSSRSFAGTTILLTGETITTAPSHPETVTHNITFWTYGFTIDDGPLRRMDDPENASFVKGYDIVCGSWCILKALVALCPAVKEPVPTLPRLNSDNEDVIAVGEYYGEDEDVIAIR
ncbi:hypothetical protein ACET3Z_028027 [Daucus carota]